MDKECAKSLSFLHSILNTFAQIGKSCLKCCCDCHKRWIQLQLEPSDIRFWLTETSLEFVASRTMHGYRCPLMLINQQRRGPPKSASVESFAMFPGSPYSLDWLQFPHHRHLHVIMTHSQHYGESTSYIFSYNELHRSRLSERGVLNSWTGHDDGHKLNLTATRSSSSNVGRISCRRRQTGITYNKLSGWLYESSLHPLGQVPW